MAKIGPTERQPNNGAWIAARVRVLQRGGAACCLSRLTERQVLTVEDAPSRLLPVSLPVASDMGKSTPHPGMSAPVDQVPLAPTQARVQSTDTELSWLGDDPGRSTLLLSCLKLDHERMVGPAGAVRAGTRDIDLVRGTRPEDYPAGQPMETSSRSWIAFKSRPQPPNAGSRTRKDIAV